MSGADGWQLSNPSIVSLAVLRASMDIFHEAGMERLRAKSVSLTGLSGVLAESEGLSKFLDHHAAGKGERRGAQLSIRVPQNGRALCERLAQAGIVGDWRRAGYFPSCTRALVQLLSGCFPVCWAIRGRDWLAGGMVECLH